jgi:hypothetical protein
MMGACIRVTDIRFRTATVPDLVRAYCLNAKFIAFEQPLLMISNIIYQTAKRATDLTGGLDTYGTKR